MAAGRRSRSWSRAAALFLFLATVLAAWPQPRSEEGAGALDFLNDRLYVPDSERFSEADYIDSGVGLTFGVDRRLSYAAGNYEEAAARFEEAIQRYRYRSEIWVFLARSYYHMKAPDRARQTLEQAAAVMPDLRERLWSPLLKGLLQEIRRRAENLQVQVDYYTLGPDDYLSLFRLYLFAEEYRGASGVIAGVEARARKTADLAGTLTGEGHRRALAEVTRWHALAGQFRAELALRGISVPTDSPVNDSLAASPGPAPDAELLEQVRLLQLKVTFYPATPGEYQRLFTGLLALGREEQAATVVRLLDEEIARTRLQLETAATLQQEGEFQAALDTLSRLRERLQAALPGQDSTAHAPP